MYHSLLAHEPEAFLYVFAFDEPCYQVLRKLDLPQLKIISLVEFEDQDLLSIKNSRSKAEYCWTCTSSIILYCLKNFNIESVTYCDADLYFFDSPAKLIAEIPEKDSILLTEHRYSPNYDNTAVSGIYCVQFMTFKNTTDGLNALLWWREKCIEWCYARFEDGKFGDQKYLDDWLTRFKGVWVLQHEGGGLAPWNTQQYEYKLVNGKLFVENLKSAKKSPVIFYHFHYLRFYTNHPVVLAGKYTLDSTVKELVYNPYFEALNQAEKIIKPMAPNLNYHGASQYSQIPSWQKIKDKWFSIKLKLKKWLN